MFTRLALQAAAAGVDGRGMSNDETPPVTLRCANGCPFPPTAYGLCAACNRARRALTRARSWRRPV